MNNAQDNINKDIRNRKILSGLLCANIQILSLITPILMGKIIDEYIPSNNWKLTAISVFLFIFIPFVSITLQTLWNYHTIKYVRQKSNDYTLRVMKNLIYQDMKFFDKENSLELLTYAGKEFTNYISFFVMEVPEYVVGLLASLIIFIILIFINPLVALVQLLYIPLAFYPVKLMMKSIDNDVSCVLQKNAEINQIKGDVLKQIEFIKLSCIEKNKLREIDEKNHEINKVWGRLATIDSLSGIWTSGFVTVLFTGITFSLGIFLLANKFIQIGQLVSSISYCGILYFHINSALKTSLKKRKEEVAYGKSFSYLNLLGEEYENRNKCDFSFNSSIEIKNLSFSYKDKLVLKDINLHINKGDWVSIIGQSGAGKSTLLDLFVKLYSVKNNMIYIDGIDINKINSFSIRENITKVTQDIFLFPGTIKDNMMIMNENLKDEDLIKALEFASLKSWYQALPNGLNTDVGEMGKLMSGGEKQRLSIAMGYLRGCKIYLLDEITSALDEDNIKIIANNFKKLQSEGCTIISVTHNPIFAVYSDKIYEIINGKIVFKSQTID